jgi:hypothetical protein
MFRSNGRDDSKAGSCRTVDLMMGFALVKLKEDLVDGGRRKGFHGFEAGIEMNAKYCENFWVTQHQEVMSSWKITCGIAQFITFKCEFQN